MFLWSPVGAPGGFESWGGPTHPEFGVHPCDRVSRGSVQCPFPRRGQGVQGTRDYRKRYNKAYNYYLKKMSSDDWVECAAEGCAKMAREAYMPFCGYKCKKDVTGGDEEEEKAYCAGRRCNREVKTSYTPFCSYSCQYNDAKLGTQSVVVLREAEEAAASLRAEHAARQQAAQLVADLTPITRARERGEEALEEKKEKEERMEVMKKEERALAGSEAYEKEMRSLEEALASRQGEMEERGRRMESELMSMAREEERTLRMELEERLSKAFKEKEEEMMEEAVERALSRRMEEIKEQGRSFEPEEEEERPGDEEAEEEDEEE